MHLWYSTGIVGFWFVLFSWLVLLYLLCYCCLAPILQRLGLVLLSRVDTDKQNVFFIRAFSFQTLNIPFYLFCLLIFACTFPLLLSHYSAWCQQNYPAQHALAVEIIRVFDENHINWVFSGGTLLGMLRNGRFLPWEHDVDFAICLSEWPAAYAALRAASLTVEHFITVDGTGVLPDAMKLGTGGMAVIGRVHPLVPSFWLGVAEVWADIEVRIDGKCHTPPMRLRAPPSAPAATALPAVANHVVHPLALRSASERALATDDDKEAVDLWISAQHTLHEVPPLIADCISYRPQRLQAILGAHRALIGKAKAAGLPEWGVEAVQGGADFVARSAAAAGLSQAAAAEYARNVPLDPGFDRICVPAGGSPLARLRAIKPNASFDIFLRVSLYKGGFDRHPMQCAIWLENADIREMVSTTFG